MRAFEQDRHPLVEQVHGGFLAALQRRQGHLGRQRGLAAAGRTHQQRARPAIQPAGKDRVELGDAGLDLLAGRRLALLHRDQPGIDDDAAGADLEVVQPFEEPDVAQLLDPQAAPVGAELGRQVLERDHPVHERVQGKAADTGDRPVGEDDRAVVLEQARLERFHVEAVARPLARQVAQLREAVDHDPGRAQLVDPGPDPLDHLGEFDLRGMEQGLLAGLAEDAAQVREVHDLDAVERPAMRSGEGGQLVERLGKGDQEGALLARHADLEELEAPASSCPSPPRLPADRGRPRAVRPPGPDPGRRCRWIDVVERSARAC